MKLLCCKCNNEHTFMATAQVEIDVLVNGEGKVIDPRAAEQPLGNLVVLRPWKCCICGSTDITDTEENDGNNSTGEGPED